MGSTSELSGTDQTSRRLVPLTRLRGQPVGRDGTAPHIATLTRWILKGARLRDGTRVRLRAIRAPGGWRSCAAWLDEFLDALTRDRLGVDSHDACDAAPILTTASPHPPSPRRRPARERQAAAERAGKLLESMGC